MPEGLTASVRLAIDPRVTAFALCISLATGLLFGLIPALQASRRGVGEALKQGGRGGVGLGSRRLRDVLVVAEVALALVLLVGAGLMIQTLARIYAVDLGFNPDRLLTMQTWLSRGKYPDGASRLRYYDEVLARIGSLPGVESAAFGSDLPLTAMGDSNGFVIEGRQQPVNALEHDALYRLGTNDYLKTLGVRLREGRLFTRDDRAETLPVLIINEAFANAYWPNESPLGKRIQVDGPPWATIVGVVRDVRERGIAVPMKPAVYFPVVQGPERWAVPTELVIRNRSDPAALVTQVREAIWAVDRDQAIARVQTMENIVEDDVASRRPQMTLLGAFATLALILASLGIYGVLSYLVSQRTREIGVRMALGASVADVLRMVAVEGVRLAGTGLVVGIAGAYFATRVLTRLLYGVRPTDPATYVAVALLLAAVALVACSVPAVRASRVDPMVALREE